MIINRLTTAKKVGISALIFIPTFYLTTKTTNKLLLLEIPQQQEQEQPNHHHDESEINTSLTNNNNNNTTNNTIIHSQETTSFWNKYWNDMTSSATAGTIGATVAGFSTYLGGPALASALGFGSGGVGLGTTAATMMSSAGNVAAGSLIASLQSVGATGAVALGTTVLPIALLVGGGVAVGSYYWNAATKKQQEMENGKVNSEEKNQILEAEKKEELKMENSEKDVKLNSNENVNHSPDSNTSNENNESSADNNSGIMDNIYSAYNLSKGACNQVYNGVYNGVNYGFSAITSSTWWKWSK